MKKAGLTGEISHTLSLSLCARTEEEEEVVVVMGRWGEILIYQGPSTTLAVNTNLSKILSLDIRKCIILTAPQCCLVPSLQLNISKESQ